MSEAKMDREPVMSPCVSVCAFDEATGWCRGCRRSLDEIAHWMAYCETERIAILEDLKTRQL